MNCKRNRTRPRNPYRSTPLVNAVNRAWRQRANLPDLDQLYSATMQEDDIQNPIEITIALRGTTRTISLPPIPPERTSLCLDHLDHHRRTCAVEADIADRVERILAAISGAAR